MKKEKEYHVLISVIFMICVITTAVVCGCNTQTPVSTGGILKVGGPYEKAFFGYPPRSTAPCTQSAPALEPLFRLDKSNKEVPWLATGYTNDVNGKTITIPVRKGVKFHDGTDFNAEAVKWNLDKQIESKAGGTNVIKSVDIVDDYTVRINLTQWDNTFITNLTQATGAIISPTAYKQNGQDWCAGHPVGTGPFKLVSFDRDVKTLYEKFDGYWQKGKPNVDRIEWIPIPNKVTSKLALQGGEVDALFLVPIPDVAELEQKGFVKSVSPVPSGAWSLIPNTVDSSSPWGNLKVRQAAQYAIDSAAIVKSIYKGIADTSNQYAPKTHWAYNPSVVGYPYNPTKAKQLLAEAGYPNGFKTKLSYQIESSNTEDIVADQGFLKAVGIDAELIPLTQAKWTDVAFNGGSWEGLLWASSSPNPDTAAVLLSRLTGGKYYSKMQIPDDYLTAVKNAIAATNFNDKQKFVWEAQKLLIDKYCNMIILYCGYEASVVNQKVQNHGLNSPVAVWWTPEDVWLKK